MVKLLIIFQIMQIPQTKAEVWNWISPSAELGGSYGSQNLYGLRWPGPHPLKNDYLYSASFVIGVKENNTAYVTRNDYALQEWGNGKLIYQGPGTSEEDIIVSWHDSLTNFHNGAGRHLGVTVICKSYTWSYEPWNDFIAYEFFVIWNKNQCDIPNVGDTLNNLFLGLYYDCDVSSADPTEPYIDDLVFFDGYVAGEWDTLGYPYDSITLLPDTFLNIPDGIYDQYIVYGNDSLEHTIHGDTLILPRNLSYMWDDDNPATPGNDKGENGYSAGYVGVALLYSPPSPADSIWIDAYGDTCRIPRVWSHKSWNWEQDPPTDEEFYKIMAGESGRFDYLPSSVFDYRFLISSGPFNVADGETLKFVFVAAVGQELNGGYDSIYGRNWIRGLRQTIDYALTAYYAGSEISDPYHPSGPDEDIHWKILSISEKNYKRISLNFPTILNSSYILKTKEPLKIEIYNASGRKINEILVKDKGMPFKNLKGGIYFIKINKKDFKKFIILQ